MGDNLYGSSIHDGIDVPKFHYDGVHTVGPDFYEDVLMTIGKNWDEEEYDEFHNKFQNEERALKGRVKEPGIV